MFTLKQVNHAMRDKKLPSMSQLTDQAFSKALEGRLIISKIAKDCPAERNTYDLMNSRRSYALSIMNPAISNLRKRFVDEFGINVHLRRSQGRLARDDRVYQKCRGWYNHTMTQIPDCLAMKPIDG